MGRVYKDLGMSSPTDAGNYEIDAVTYSRFFRVLYNSTYLSRTMSEYALELLSRGSFSDGLPAGVPNGVLVAHQFGERTHPATGERQLHDCGIVYAPTRPYLLCVMTRGKEFKQLASVISDISREVYREMELSNQGDY
jgi:beta-lactamase class A